MPRRQGAAVLPLFPRVLQHYARAAPASMQPSDIDVIIESCAVFAETAEGLAGLQAHYRPLASLCARGLQAADKDRIRESWFQLLVLLVAYCPSCHYDIVIQDLALPLMRQWSTSRPPSGTSLQALVVCACHANHPQVFNAYVQELGSGVVAELLIAAEGPTRRIPTRVAMLFSALSLARGLPDDFWRDYLFACSELISYAEKKGNSAAPRVFQVLSRCATKLPAPVRSDRAVQCACLPAEWRMLYRDGALDERVLVQKLIEQCAQLLKQLLAASPAGLQATLASRPQPILSALQALGL